MPILQDLREKLNTGQRRQYAILGALAALFLAAGIFFLGPSDSSGMRGKGREIVYACRNCRNTGHLRLAYGEPFPIRCPMCGKRTAMLGFICNGCGSIFEDLHQAYFQCPKCQYVYGTPPATTSAPASRAVKGK